MGLLDRLRDAVSDDDGEGEVTPAHPEAAGPAAAKGDTPTATPGSATSGLEGGELSDAASGLGADLQTAEGGADAVPDTPDGVAENYT